MTTGSPIESITARQIFSHRGHPAIETTVVTKNGGSGIAAVTPGASVGKYEVKFAYDDQGWAGMGVQTAITTVQELIAPALNGMDATRQRAIDFRLLEMDGTPNKSNLGGNAIASVSAAVLKAGAASLGLPLYQHIGGSNACILPTPGVICMVGHTRYEGSQKAGGKPTYSFMCHGFNTFSEASYACWQVRIAFDQLLHKRFNIKIPRTVDFPWLPPGMIQHDRELWDLMVQAVGQAGFEGQVGFQVDVAAGCYYDPQQKKYMGLFSKEDKARDDLVRLYREMTSTYPFLIIEDPLDEDDFDGHALLTRELDIEIVGDDLFATNQERFMKGLAVGAANTVLLKVNQIGTITEAFDLVHRAYRNGYGVMPCNSRGEGDDIADYCVGLGTGHLREGGTGTVANRLLKIEQELGKGARFLGKGGFKP
jgi:enolase